MDGASALFWACARGHESVAEMLIAVGADVNAARNGDFSVMNAAIGNQGSIALVEALIREGASLEHRFLNRDILQYAEWSGRQDLVSLMKRRRQLPTHQH
jgi:ankyrin repeat protein